MATIMTLHDNDAAGQLQGIGLPLGGVREERRHDKGHDRFTDVPPANDAIELLYLGHNDLAPAGARNGVVWLASAASASIFFRFQTGSRMTRELLTWALASAPKATSLADQIGGTGQ